MNKKNKEEKIKDEELELSILRHYVKDLSFENLISNPTDMLDEKKADNNLQCTVKQRAVDEENGLYEVVVHIRISSNISDDKKLFVLDNEYGALLLIKNANDQAKITFIMVEAPTIIFPFSRAIIINTIREGGFSTPRIPIINFRKMFLDEIERNRKLDTKVKEGTKLN